MNEFISWLDEQSAGLLAEGRRLTADNRKDEGNFAKIRSNVYGICKTVIQVQGREKAKTILVGLHDTWNKQLVRANEHDDVKQAVIEEIKLKTLAEIVKKLEEV